jgi:glycosyltransferase involved in cell wall biosynthesis
MSGMDPPWNTASPPFQPLLPCSTFRRPLSSFFPSGLRVVMDYRPALRARSGVGEYVHQIADALTRSYPEDCVTLFTSSWKDRPAPGLPADRVADYRIPVRVLNFTWHNLEWPPVEWLTGERCDVAFSPHPLLMPARRAAQVVMIHDADADRQGIYSGARVLVVPSFEEGFGMVALEAMSLGIPVIASAVGALPDLVQDAGLLIEPSDPGSIARALTRILRDEALANTLSARGVARASTFSWERTATLVRETFRAAICASVS